MSSYDFIIDNIRFSYSSSSTFYTCPLAFKLSYIDKVTPRAENFYGEYGLLIHECFEAFFRGEVEAYELSQYYQRKYLEMIKTPCPTPPEGLEETYKRQGKEFFDNFWFDRSAYETLIIEDKIDFELDGVMLVAKPDLVLRHKETGKTSLVDYKSSIVFRTNKHTGKETTDQKKLTGYYKQLYLYTYALRVHANIPIDDITIWFVRPLERFLTTPWLPEKEEKALGMLRELIAKIKAEEEFKADTSAPYFCNNICSVREYCEFR